MIALASDCMMFKLANGDTVPFSPTNITIEVDAGTASGFDPDFIRHAANAVFHFFQYELKRETISVAEFAEAMEKVLSGFSPAKNSLPAQEKKALYILESDLVRLARESGKDADLFFFSILREELRRQLKHAPHIVRFRGLRCCVKHLTGARRWNGRCRLLQEQIVEYLRKCLDAERGDAERALVVD